MFETLLTALLPSLCVSIIMALFNREQRKREDASKERELQRSESETVQVALLVAAAKLSYAVAMAIKRGSPNGEVEEGIEQYKEAMAAFKKFERRLVAKTGIK